MVGNIFNRSERQNLAIELSTLRGTEWAVNDPVIGPTVEDVESTAEDITLRLRDHFKQEAARKREQIIALNVANPRAAYDLALRIIDSSTSEFKNVAKTGSRCYVTWVAQLFQSASSGEILTCGTMLSMYPEYARLNSIRLQKELELRDLDIEVGKNQSTDWETVRRLVHRHLILMRLSSDCLEVLVSKRRLTLVKTARLLRVQKRIPMIFEIIIGFILFPTFISAIFFSWPEGIQVQNTKAIKYTVSAYCIAVLASFLPLNLAIRVLLSNSASQKKALLDFYDDVASLAIPVVDNYQAWQREQIPRSADSYFVDIDLSNDYSVQLNAILARVVPLAPNAANLIRVAFQTEVPRLIQNRGVISTKAQQKNYVVEALKNQPVILGVLETQLPKADLILQDYKDGLSRLQNSLNAAYEEFRPRTNRTREEQNILEQCQKELQLLLQDFQREYEDYKQNLEMTDKYSEAITRASVWFNLSAQCCVLLTSVMPLCKAANSLENGPLKQLVKWFPISVSIFVAVMFAVSTMMLWWNKCTIRKYESLGAL